MKKSKHVIPIILFALSAFCLLVGAAILFLEHSGELTVEHTHTHLNNEAKNTETSVSSTPIVSVEELPLEKEEPTETVSLDEVSSNEEAVEEVIPVENPYKDYFLQNTDMAGWLKIEDTIVDYPVMWTPGDENYYLYRNFDKKKGKGCLILDTDSKLCPSSTNLIIHGHTYDDNRHIYFGELNYYEDKSYRDEHPIISLYAQDCEHRYEVMAVFRSQVFYETDTCFKYYKFFNAYSEEEFKDFYDNVMALSFYDTGVTASFGDKFITLSTCSNHVENGRLVVVGKEIEPGDSYIAIDYESNNDN